MASLPELAISFQGVDSDTQAAIQSVEEDFFGQHSSSSSDSSEACLPGYNLSTSILTTNEFFSICKSLRSESK